MEVRNQIQSPNFSPNEIPVEFVVLHYTACDLKKTLEIFADPNMKVCSHFVLDIDGKIYDLGNFLTGPIRQGAHAGESVFSENGKTWKAFNQFSIGIEIVNLNGNYFEYSEAQNQALQELMSNLKKRFPILEDPFRIVGHEQIAGHRGKADPGVKFDWSRFYNMNYKNQGVPQRKPRCSPADVSWLSEEINKNRDQQKSESFWPELSTAFEVRLRGEALSKKPES